MVLRSGQGLTSSEYNPGYWFVVTGLAAVIGLMPRPVDAQSTAAPDTRREEAAAAAIPAQAQAPSDTQARPTRSGEGVLSLQGEQGGRGAAPPSGVLAGRPTISALRAAQPPSIDGRLDDAIWRNAPLISTFTQQTPNEGAPASELTEIRVAYDNERLYFSVYAHYADRRLMRANRVDRDKTDEEDTVTFSFDPFLDQQTGYSFNVNGYGVQTDSSLARNAATSQGDVAWNVLFASAGQVVEDGWTAEMAIPFKSLRYPARASGQAHRWGFQIEREIKAKNELSHWAPLSRDVTGYLRQMGVIEGIVNLSTSHNFEVLPTFTAVKSTTVNKTTGTYGDSDLEEGGVNVKYGLTSNLTLDATYNPDFSQIESDRQQIEVNQRFPVQYPELRPFFLEGANIFTLSAGPNLNMVHTRTIVDPQFGAKVTGKVGKTTVGFMIANDEGPGKVDDSRDPAYSKKAQVAFARARYDYGSEQSVGVLYTDREFLTGHSRLGGVDANFRLSPTQRLTTFFLVAHREDLAGNRKTGYVYEFNTRKEGRHFGYFVGHHWVPADFGTDLGFVRRTNFIETTSRVSYKWWPETWLVNYWPEANYSTIYDYDKTLINSDVGITFNIQFARNINAVASYHRLTERYRNVDFDKSRVSVSGTVNASRRVSFTGKIDQGDEVRFVVNPFLGTNRIYSASSIIRPFSRLQSAINLDTTDFTDPRLGSPQAFNIKILRVQTTYQFTPRLLLRSIVQRNTFNKTLDNNVLMTYRVNSGTAFYVGYDDHFAEGSMINPALFDPTAFQRTNRAVFTKLQYLFRRGGN